MVTIPRYVVLNASTWEIRVIPPFLAALLIPQSAEPPKIERTVVAFATPHLLPTGFEVATIGVVVEQLEAAKRMPHERAILRSFFIK